ncbi:solute carrier family 22 member 4 isoform X3 [Scophthalmus maximus]|uniref:solute carrier family 22 member 4 isoform X3 n=1 Tax=Scophthalmus maximus TaxID=52904 RepID=UPI0015E14C0E|nr:solute carrier family 22 member 4 isoform X3 [Scophthalmus maximus]
MKDYATSVAFLGQWGRFQKVVFFLLCSTIVPNGFGAFTLIFLTDVPSHRCLVPDVGVNLTEEWRRSIIPVQVVNGKEELSRCTRYRLDVVRNLSAQGYSPGRDVNLTDLEQEGCVDGWSYSTDVYQSTVVSEFDLVCGDEWKQPLTASVFFVGSLCGSFFSGQLSDRFGRKPVLFATIAVQAIFTFVQVFSVSWIMFLILLFFNGLGQIANFVAALVLGAEILIGNVRVLYSSLGTCLGFAVGYMILPVFAYFVRDWRFLLLASSLPCLVYLPLWWFIPESPRWLLCQGRVEEAEAIVRKAAKWNKCQAPSVIFEDHSVHCDHWILWPVLQHSSTSCEPLHQLFHLSSHRGSWKHLQLASSAILSTTTLCHRCFAPRSSATVPRSTCASKSTKFGSCTGDIGQICFYLWYLHDVCVLSRALPNIPQEHSDRDSGDHFESGNLHYTISVEVE